MKMLQAWRIYTALAVLGAAPLTVAVADSDPAEVGPAAFVNHSQMLNWLANGERGLWIQATDLNWFYAHFAHLCRGLNSTNSLLFDTQVSGNIDRGSSVVVPGGGRCVVVTFTRSSGPPKSRNADVAPEPQAQ